MPAELVQAALRAADQLGRQVANVPLTAIATAAGISRSTLLRRLGGSRTALDGAIRAAGVDPGGQPVKARALAAAADLISEIGVGTTTLDAIAARAGCSVDSLFAIFGTRDELLAAVFERYSPIADIGDALGTDHTDLSDTVRDVYRRLAQALSRQPRVTPALLAEVLARPTSPAVRSIVRSNAPTLFAVIGDWLATEIQAGRIRDLPIPLLMHQFAAPIMIHMLLRPLATDRTMTDLPDLDRTCEIFAEAFLGAVAPEAIAVQPHRRTGRGEPSHASPEPPARPSASDEPEAGPDRRDDATTGRPPPPRSAQWPHL
ncbi:MAG: TetR/AcrR family transcriptional regulator [Dactylosporangium sp.]|nr:TetR/AcrR family transcriptional regulator [Dactylosporangium sp.]